MKRSVSDVVIVGSGMGGSTAALALAPTGASILILEQGMQIRAEPLDRDARAIFQRGAYAPREQWFDTAGHPHPAGTHATVGGSGTLGGRSPGGAHDVGNLFVVDGSVFVCSAAVNPALTIAASSLPTADHVARTALAP